jgi:hypothetical protein
VGLTKTQREDFESLLKGSMGIQGIASIESGIKAKTGMEVTFECVINEKEEHEFTAPQCGRRTLTVYQLIREYDLSITEKNFFTKDMNKIHLTEYTDNYHDESLTIFNDQNCGCRDQPSDPDDGILRLLLDSKYELVSAYQQLENKISVKNLNIDLSMEDLGKMVVGNLKIKSSDIPQYIKYLADIKEEVSISLRSDANIIFDYPEQIKVNIVSVTREARKFHLE